MPTCENSILTKQALNSGPGSSLLLPPPHWLLVMKRHIWTVNDWLDDEAIGWELQMRHGHIRFMPLKQDCVWEGDTPTATGKKNNNNNKAAGKDLPQQEGDPDSNRCGSRRRKAPDGSSQHYLEKSTDIWCHIELQPVTHMMGKAP